jgi:hypothetical protein
MYKQLSFPAILLIALLLLASCSPAVEPLSTPMVTDKPTPTLTPVITATPVPTATPRTEPYTVEECEAILEAITGTDVTYTADESSIDSFYHYEDSTHWYTMNRLKGKFFSYISRCKTSPQANEIEIEDLEQIAKDELKKYCPSLLDLEVDVEKNICGNEHQIYFFQLSPIHSRRTGNNGYVTLHPNGDLDTITILNNEDPKVADKPLKINKKQALEIAYEASLEKLKKLIECKPDTEVEIDDRSKHDVEIEFTVCEGIPIWRISIKFPSNAPFIIGYCVTIDANTGEVLMCNGYR